MNINNASRLLRAIRLAWPTWRMHNISISLQSFVNLLVS